MALGSDIDSGMASQNEDNDLSPVKPEITDGTELDEADETLAERLWGLTEMFPEPVRNLCGTISDLTTYGCKSFYSLSRSAFWVCFSSSIILFAPILMECERVQVEDMQRNQQKQMLLGPNSAVSGGMPAMPPLSR